MDLFHIVLAIYKEMKGASRLLHSTVNVLKRDSRFPFFITFHFERLQGVSLFPHYETTVLLAGIHSVEYYNFQFVFDLKTINQFITLSNKEE